MKIFFVKGKLCRVDDIDARIVEDHSWCLNKGKLNYTWYLMYGQREGKKGRKVYLHRLITSAQKGDRVDFLSQDTLDCRRSNLLLNGRRFADI